MNDNLQNYFGYKITLSSIEDDTNSSDDNHTEDSNNSADDNQTEDDTNSTDDETENNEIATGMELDENTTQENETGAVFNSGNSFSHNATGIPILLLLIAAIIGFSSISKKD
ncbi:hypothetical protein [Methanobrevibacter sp.]|uniref:hypothetical protein n=1 Tax=Methanobrevibacter sp. TaxID=66852 RepID=UPI0025F9D2AE|nr:hypothetical protein [Methanobrevibacter sp.]MBQ2666762.1 hypothetical protein [Methanobrevibacter sp.]